MTILPAFTLTAVKMSQIICEEDLLNNSSSEESEGSEQASIDDVTASDFTVNKEGKIVKKKDKQPKYTNGEMVIVWHWFENHHKELYGTGKGSNIAYEKS